MSAIKENPEKRLSFAINGGDLRRFSETDFLNKKRNSDFFSVQK